jgi:hypothetical protein
VSEPGICEPEPSLFQFLGSYFERGLHGAASPQQNIERCVSALGRDIKLLLQRKGVFVGIAWIYALNDRLATYPGARPVSRRVVDLQLSSVERNRRELHFVLLAKGEE